TRLADLILNNPRAATQALVVVKNSQSQEEWEEYVGVLVDMKPVNVNSMEVVNGLLKEKLLDRNHLHFFVRNCIQSCENSGSDASSGRSTSSERQGRLVRMACVFVQTLIRTKCIDVSEGGADNALLVDLRHFVVQFAKIKEAVSLYKLLESLSFNPNQLGG
ncbi:CCR4-NOT transcription complex subunit 11, partial [Acrasis kona]